MKIYLVAIMLSMSSLSFANEGEKSNGNSVSNAHCYAPSVKGCDSCFKSCMMLNASERTPGKEYGSTSLKSKNTKSGTTKQ